MAGYSGVLQENNNKKPCSKQGCAWFLAGFSGFLA
jgi:hypothetical protein